MAQANSGRGGGVGFVGLLTIVFIALKLTKVIDWNWLWVLSPIWATIVIVIVAAMIVAWAQERQNDPWRRLR